MTPLPNDPQAGNPSPSASESRPGDRSLVPAGDAYPLVVDSEGFEEEPSDSKGAGQSGGPAALLKALQQRWLLALVVGLACGSVAGAAMWFLKSPKYTAYALLQVASSEHRLLEGNRDNDSGRSTYQKTQAALITSRPILRGALKEDKVRQLPLVQEHPEAEQWIEKDLKVGYIEDTDILRISLTGSKPNDLALLINAIQESYMAQIVYLEHKRKLSLRDDVDAIVMRAQINIRRERTALQVLAKIVHTGDPQVLTVKQRSAAEEYAALKRESGSLRSELRKAQLRLKIQEAKSRPGENLPVPEFLVDDYLNNDPDVKAQAMEVAHAQERVQKLKPIASEGSRLLAQPQEELRIAQKKLEDLRKEKRPGIVKRVRQQIAYAADTGAGQIQEEIKFLESQKEEMDKEINQVGGEFALVGTTSVDLEMKRADIEQAENMLKQLQQEKQRLAVELESTAFKRVTLLQEAEVPESPNTKGHIQESILVGLCALAFGALCIGYWEYRARWINTPDQVTQDLGMRVVGTLPDLSTLTRRLRDNRDNGSSAVPTQILIESIDNIRAVLSCGHSPASIRVLMVTSAVSREGKTTVATQLATSFARAGKRTLLIDFDLRRPSLHQILNVSQGPGVCEVLRNEVDVSLAIRPTEVPGLSLLPAGQPSRLSHTACLQECGGEFFDRLRAQYDFIVVDSSPILPVPDSLFIGQHVDAAVVSIRPRVSRSPMILEACERLRTVRIRVLGTVVNGVRAPTHDGYYHYLAQDKS